MQDLKTTKMSKPITPGDYVMEIYKILDLSKDEVLFIEEAETIMRFIDKCSLTDFERLKDMNYDLSQNDAS